MTGKSGQSELFVGPGKGDGKVDSGLCVSVYRGVDVSLQTFKN